MYLKMVFFLYLSINFWNKQTQLTNQILSCLQNNLKYSASWKP